MALLLIVIPFLLAGGALRVPSNRHRPWLLPLGAALHLAGTIRYLALGPDKLSEQLWLAPDPPGKLVLLLLSSLYCLCAWYTANGPWRRWPLRWPRWR